MQKNKQNIITIQILKITLEPKDRVLKYIIYNIILEKLITNLLDSLMYTVFLLSNNSFVMSQQKLFCHKPLLRSQGCNAL